MAPNSIKSRPVRIPTQEEYSLFDGAHCRVQYSSLDANWTCPGCGRSRFQILRWTIIFPKRPDRHEGWAAGIHTHHDHGSDAAGRFFHRAAARFPPTKICEQCNAADGAAKRKLGLLRSFSFSPEEIRQFVRGTPHGFHEVNYEIALEIYQKIRGELHQL